MDKNNKKRILVLNYEFPPLGGGAGNATFYLLKEFSKNKDLKIILVTSSVGEYKHEKFNDNIDIYFLNIGKNGELHNQSNKDLLIYSWKAFWFCKELKNKEKFDLIHAFFGIPCGFVAMLLKIPYIVSLRGSDVPGQNPKFKFIYFLLGNVIKKVWKNAKSVVANSEDLKKVALNFKNDLNIEVIKNGVNCKKFSPSAKDNIFRILYVGRFHEVKGISYLLNAFDKFSKDKNNIELFLVGDGKLFLEMKKNYQNQKNIKFFGKIDQNDLAYIYKKSDVFVLPSFQEGMNNGLLEAMASGLAIISTDTGGAKVLIKENGFIVRTKNIEDIILSLGKMYLDRGLLKDMKIRSRELAKKMSWSIIADKYLEIYKKL